jgi:hypothetical protein
MTTKARGVRATTSRPAASKPAAKQDPDRVWVDTNDLTAGEIEAIEEVSGASINYYGQIDKAQGRLSRAIGWAFRSRTDPSIVYEDKACDRGVRPQCGDCHCSRRLKVLYRITEAPVPPSGENGS